MKEHSTRTKFSRAPFPFIGQKRNFVTLVENSLQSIPNQGEGYTVVDVFGGSGLLSNVAKRVLPKARVIFNDYDNYSKRVEARDELEEIRLKLSAVMIKHGIKEKKQLGGGGNR